MCVSERRFTIKRLLVLSSASDSVSGGVDQNTQNPELKGNPYGRATTWVVYLTDTPRDPKLT
jgi:hypothetical protein